MRSLFCSVALLATMPMAASQDGTEAAVRLEQLVEANITAVHAYQILLARRVPGSDPLCYPPDSPPVPALEKLVAHQEALLATPPDSLKKWISGKPSTFDPSKDLAPLLRFPLAMPENLPVNVLSSYLHQQAPQVPRTSLRAISNLYQMDLEQERDGDRLQELFGFYISLGLPVYVGQLGLPGADDDFLLAARSLAGRSCASPVGLSLEDWQIAGRKIWNWGEKRLHIRDARVVAHELLNEPAISDTIPAMKILPAQRIAVIGHSFTMDVHWASPSAFVPIVTAMFELQNPLVEFRQFQAGGLTSSRAYRNFYRDALAWKPSAVLLVLINRTPQDILDLKAMGRGFREANIRAFMFDDLLDSNDSTPGTRQEALSAARETGISIVPVGSVLAAAPDKGSFLSLDHIHMTEPYHRIMAKEWLKVILAMNGGKYAPESPREEDH